MSQYQTVKPRPSRSEFFARLETATFSENRTNSPADYAFMVAAREAFHQLPEESQNRIADHCTGLSSKVRLLGVVAAFEIVVKIGRVRHNEALKAQRQKDAQAARA